jgi:hypothetical protein
MNGSGAQFGRRMIRLLIKGVVAWTLWTFLSFAGFALLGLPVQFSGDPTPKMWLVDISTLVIVVAVMGRLNWPDWPKLHPSRLTNRQ